jgi:hypothetical protein
MFGQLLIKWRQRWGYKPSSVDEILDAYARSNKCGHDVSVAVKKHDAAKKLFWDTIQRTNDPLLMPVVERYVRAEAGLKEGHGDGIWKYEQIIREILDNMQRQRR